MPGFDGMGPAGAGPMTGRKMGLCGGGMSYGRRYGRRLGRGLGAGRFAWQNYQGVTTDEKTALNNEIKALQDELETAKKRLEEIEEQK